MVSVSNHTLKPSDCVLVCGIPICEEDFWDAKDDGLERDFAINCCPVWDKYYVEAICYLEKIEPYLKKLGVRIIHRLKLSDFRNLFDDNLNKVIILFSHWKDDSVEFFDGMATSDAVVNEVPENFEGIIDLCVCHPTNLVIKLRNHLPPSSLIRFIDKKTTPYKWLYFYWAVFTILHDSEVSYLEALEQSVKAFAEI
ncbi:MAG: hypothetical protein WA584_16375 [Pyrinomonadaceae bacterium]